MIAQTLSAEDWNYTRGPRGGNIWTNVKTGEIRRQKENPGGKEKGRVKEDSSGQAKARAFKKYDDPRYVAAREEWFGSLSDDEMNAFRAWSGSVDMATEIRNYQAGLPGRHSQHVKSVTETIAKALDRAPKLATPVYRGLNFRSSEDRKEFIALMLKNKGMATRGFTSTSRSREIASKFSDDYYGVVLIIRSKSGVSISFEDIAILNEDEVLLREKTKLRYDFKTKIMGEPKFGKSGTIYIGMTEV